jgi:RNase P subunit RPR2
MSGYCKYCDSLVNTTIKQRDSKNNVVWVGCPSCYEKKIEQD